MRWNAYVHRLDLELHSHPKKIDRMESESMLFPKEKKTNKKKKTTTTLYRRLRGGSNPRHCIRQDSEPKTPPTAAVVELECFHVPATCRVDLRDTSAWTSVGLRVAMVTQERSDLLPHPVTVD